MDRNLFFIIHLYVDMMKELRGYSQIRDDIKGGKQEWRGGGKEHVWQLS